MEAAARPTPPPATLDELWSAVDAVPGWLTRDQAQDLWDAVAGAPADAVAVEVGSHHGRSTVVLASARPDVRVTAVDPFVTARLFAGPSVRGAFEKTVRWFGVDDRVDLRPVRSRDARQEWSGTVDVLYVDGKHDLLTVGDDLRWVDHVRPGGAVLVHDAFSSIGVTLGLLLFVLPRQQLRYTGRTGSLASFVVARPSAGDRTRMLRELPWWGRNVGIKVLLRLRLHRVARALGHDDPYDPY